MLAVYCPQLVVGCSTRTGYHPQLVVAPGDRQVSSDLHLEPSAGLALTTSSALVGVPPPHHCKLVPASQSPHDGPANWVTADAKYHQPPHHAPPTTAPPTGIWRCVHVAASAAASVGVWGAACMAAPPAMDAQDGAPVAPTADAYSEAGAALGAAPPCSAPSADYCATTTPAVWSAYPATVTTTPATLRLEPTPQPAAG